MTMRNNKNPKLHKNKIRHIGVLWIEEKSTKSASHTEHFFKGIAFCECASRRSGKKHPKELNGKVDRNMKFFPKLGYRLEVAWLLESWCKSDKSWKRVESYGNPSRKIPWRQSIRRANWKSKTNNQFLPEFPHFRSMEILRTALAQLLRSTFVFNFLLFLYFRFNTFIIFLNIFNILNIG